MSALFRRCAPLAAVFLALVAFQARADYPERPIRVIVPFPAAGSADQVSRVLAPAVAKSLGQPLVIENKAGAGGAIGMEAAAKSPPDGYTLVLASIGPMSILPARPNLGYEPLRDLAPITLLTTNPFLVVVHPSVPATSIAEFIAHLKANPGRLNYASVGNGSLGHLAGELFKSQAGVDMVHVPFRGGAPALQDTIAGHTQVMFANINEALPYVKAGRLRALAVTSRQRHPVVPTIPTLDESGLAGYEAIAWNGIAAPAGTPPEIIERLRSEMDKALRSPASEKTFADLGVTPVSSTPAAFADLVRKEQTKWGDLIKKLNLKLE